MGSGSRLLKDGGLGLLLLEEEVGSLDAATGIGGLCLGILCLLNDGSCFGVVRHGDRTGQRTDDG
jgi:hypothetical protein